MMLEPLRDETSVEGPVATEYPYNIEQENADRGAQIIQVESSKLTPVLVALAALALLVSGLSMGVGWSNATRYEDAYKELERENRLLQLKVDDMRVALNAQGIATNKHAASESP